MGERVRGGEQGPPSLLATDGFYRAMAAEPRRRILYVLLERGETTVEELASALDGGDAVDDGATTADDRHRRKIKLVHVHLPVLADAGLVRYDHGDGAVEIADLEAHVTDLVRESVAPEEN